MQAFTGEILADPIFGLIAAILVVGTSTVWVLRTSEARRNALDPLGGLFDASTFDRQLESAAERGARMRPHAKVRPVPLHGQRAQFARLRAVWALETRAEALEDVARVMRASKDRSPAPLRVVDADPVFDLVEWEEIKLLPPPASQPASQAA